LTVDAGINWMNRIAGLNPATSHVIREWDGCGTNHWEIRSEFLVLVREEQKRRKATSRPTRSAAELVKV
jgi:hypothetical protein